MHETDTERDEKASFVTCYCGGLMGSKHTGCKGRGKRNNKELCGPEKGRCYPRRRNNCFPGMTCWMAGTGSDVEPAAVFISEAGYRPGKL